MQGPKPIRPNIRRSLGLMNNKKEEWRQRQKNCRSNLDEERKKKELGEMDPNMMAGLNGLAEEDQAKMASMIDQLQLRDRYVFYICSAANY